MQLFVPLALGAVIGIIARLALPPREHNATPITVLLATGGAFVGGRLGASFGWYRATDVVGIAAAIGGSLAIVAIYRALVRPRRLRPRLW